MIAAAAHRRIIAKQAALIIAIPVGFVYNLFLDSLVQGFTMGAVKG